MKNVRRGFKNRPENPHTYKWSIDSETRQILIDLLKGCFLSYMAWKSYFSGDPTIKGVKQIFKLFFI